MSRIFIIGTRGSDLALWQAHTVKGMLEEQGYSCSITTIKTKGDEVQNLSFDKMEGKGFFTKEIEDALLKNEIDIAVHSYKDLETLQPEGLLIGATLEREDARDILLIRKEEVDRLHPYGLKKNARIGTSSQRRRSLIDLFFPHCSALDLRGNVPTRIKKLQQGNFDAIILAYAGIKRLNIDVSEFETFLLPAENFIPAAAQGVLAMQCRQNDTKSLEALKKLNHTQTQRTIWVEREILRQLDGGCRLPIGVYAVCNDGLYTVHASYAAQNNILPKRFYSQGADATALVKLVVDKLKSQSPTHKQILISRAVEDNALFTRILESNGYKIHHCALTQYLPVEINEVPACNWIFFSSRQCVHFFFRNKPVLLKGIKFGTIGGTTTEILKQYGYTATFSGYGTDTREVGKGFARMAGNSKVLFPQSTGSYRTVQKQFASQSNLIDLVVYDTLPAENIEVPVTGVAVLTSPTNAILYLRQKPKECNPVYIAMGKSTAEILQQNGITNYILPWNPSEIALADAVMSL
jgi:hydroxymethylbilane synthase